QNRRYGLFGMVHRRFWGMDRGLAKTSPNIVGQSRPRVSIAIKTGDSAGGWPGLRRAGAGRGTGRVPAAGAVPGQTRERRAGTPTLLSAGPSGGRAHGPV